MFDRALELQRSGASMKGFGDAPTAPTGSMLTPEQVDAQNIMSEANEPLGGGSSDPGMLSEENSFLQTMRDQQLTGDAYDQMIAQQQAGVDPSLNDPYADYAGSQGLLGITNPYQQQDPFSIGNTGIKS